MTHKDFFYLGVITKPFGFKGQLFVYLDTDRPESYQNLDAVFIDLDGELIPYMIESFQLRNGNQAVISFQDLDADEAKDLIKCELYLPLNMLPPLSGNQFYFHEVIGFHVVDAHHGDIGIISDFIDLSQQPIMQINLNNTEILIPAVDEFIKKLDRENKIMYIEAPDGLIDIYLGK
ncbi:ribosome maturation factor RimM [Bacteroidales bacterium OttesenSCG-928-B11]|nr:ribosome maturation factor RimM [Bacteroidales bacterium OttesenSCG-928-E04]MDL2308097.1 ribosome maturation factor RimM [Bacteroidales bacterium OttesenSCG-928-C03]MDL2311621.1 ribosome maturation factor RimM [Bacteroidales bacterium OttesenSCG-928-B11]MDL2326755.1 ribosome maturation factor RimM [Bacteroidales bacterium OttesenSCG-928-A14]